MRKTEDRDHGKDGEGPFVGGTHESDERWREASHILGAVRSAGRPGAADAKLNEAARQSAGTELEPLLQLWIADDAMARGRYGEAAKRYSAVLRAGEGAIAAGCVHLGDSARRHLAIAQEAAGDRDGAATTWAGLAKGAIDPGQRGLALLEHGGLLERAGDERGAAASYQAAQRSKLAEHEELAERPTAEQASMALRRIDAGRAGAENDVDHLADELREALRRSDAGALYGLLAPYGVTIAAPGGDRAPFDAKRLLGHLAEGLRSGSVSADHKLLGEGDKRYLRTAGWVGADLDDEVYLTLTRDHHGWRWSGIAASSSIGWDLQEPDDDAGWDLQEPDDDDEVSPAGLGITLKAPWPAGESFEAGGVIRFGARTAAMAAASGAGGVFGTIAAAVMALRWAQSDCGFGPAGLYYGHWPTHRSRRDYYAIDFARSRRSVPFLLQVKGTRTLAASRGVVSHAVTYVPTGRSRDPGNYGNQVWINHDEWGGHIFSDRRYQSRYLHLDGPDQVVVSDAQFVEQGSRLGPMDDTGNSAFSHLHFSLHDLDDNRRSVRPSPMSGVLLRDDDGGRCVRSDNEEYIAWVLVEP